jgi:hypothetical protein
MDQLASFIAGIDISGDQLIPLVAITGSALVGIVWAIMWSIVATVQSKEAERTRREIAAYVSEGSITPEEGERLIRTTPPKRSCGA